MAYTLAFVDSITTTPTTRLSLSSGSWSAQAQGTDFPPPQLRRAVVSNLLSDGERVPAAAYGNRVLKISLQCKATTDDGCATALQNLARELDRPSNVLMYQPGTSQPVFFRTLRADYDAIHWDPRNKFATVSIPAEPFAYGPKETLPQVTVYNDPAEGRILNADPNFDTDVSNWHAAGGATISWSPPPPTVFQGPSMLITPDNVSPSPEAICEQVPVTAGGIYRASARVYSSLGQTVYLYISWYNSSGAYISSTTFSTSVGGSSVTQLTVTGTAPAGAATAVIEILMDNARPAGVLLYVDDARIRQLKTGDGNGLYFDVSGVKGDVETPLFATIPGQFSTSPGSTFGGNRQSVMAVRRRGNPAAAPLVLQAEDMTQGTDTSTQAQDAAMSGPGNNFSRTTFATNNTLTPSTDRLSLGHWPPSVSTDIRGTYRVFARVRHTTATDTFQMQLKWGSTAERISNDAVTVPADGANGPHAFFIDLGDIQLPPGRDPVNDGYSEVQTTPSDLFIALNAMRTSGSGSLDVDYLLFIPSDDRLLLISWAWSANPTDWVIDGQHETVYARNASQQVTYIGTTKLVGGFPMLSPNQTNRVVYVLDVASGPNSPPAQGITGSSPGDFVRITPYYFPRYLYVRPVTT